MNNPPTASVVFPHKGDDLSRLSINHPPTASVGFRTFCAKAWLLDEAVADNVAENLHRRDDDLYRLDAFSIMSNHVHTVFKPSMELLPERIA
ncbi:MAG TPA: hypothetical protein VLA93_03535 [Pyrinomonadaceae bacterium]|nr:hypothetical protein [Pyrinomonadaceae bacterium]